jgi:hypothetical protein
VTATPPGWPADVRPPGSPDWERSAVAWLFDQCPPDHREYDVLRRHPLVLARFAAAAVDGAGTAVENGLRTIRSELSGRVPPEAVEAAVAAYERERQRLRNARVAVDVVEQALRGKRWAPRL